MTVNNQKSIYLTNLDENSPYIRYFVKDKIFTATGISYDPEKRYAVADYYKKMFIAFKVSKSDGDLLSGEYLDMYYADDSDVPMLESYSVDWSCIQYGFCKICHFAPELLNIIGGFSHTVKRIYFDRDLYKKAKRR